jgi:L-asparagine transporter-like permease
MCGIYLPAYLTLSKTGFFLGSSLLLSTTWLLSLVIFLFLVDVSTGRSSKSSFETLVEERQTQYDLEMFNFALICAVLSTH